MKDFKNQMKMKKRTFLFVALVFLLTACQQPNSKIKEAHDLIEKLRVESESIGWTATISMDGKILLSDGFGLGNYEQQVPVYPDRTKFRIGSVSKALTAAALGTLIEEQKIDLDAPIQQYLPFFPEKKYAFTTRQAAGHIAGIRHYRGDETFSSKFYPTVKDGLEIFMNDTLLFEPGTKYSYSSYGFNLLSAIMEAAAGEEFLHLMQTRVFDPLDMNETMAEHMDSLIVYRAGYYDMSNGKVTNAPYVDNSYKWAGGGFISTSEDLVKFGNAMLDNTLLPEDIKLQLITSQRLTDGTVTGYGMGFFTGVNDFGRAYYGHSGGSIGGCSNLLIFPDKKLVLAVITNDTQAKVGRDIHELAEIFLKE